MTIPELKAILEEKDAELIASVKNAKRYSSHHMFRLLVLEHQGLLNEVKEVINGLEDSNGSFEALKSDLLHDLKSNTFSELLVHINQAKLPSTNQQLAGARIKKIGSTIYECLWISALYIAGATITAISSPEEMFLQVSALGPFIYGIYMLIWIVRIANNLKKAGALLMK